MRKYQVISRIKPRADYSDDVPFLPPLTVYEADTSPLDTGLVDANGDSIYAFEEKRQIGFIVW